MSKVDLHIHSTASDGQLSPAEVVHKSAELGLSVIALADHDTVNGIAEALETTRAYPRLTVIPAVEINTDILNGEAHVLGYFIDYTDRGLNESLEKLRDSRRLRAQKMIDKLTALGVYIEWARVQELAGNGTIGRPHVAKAILEKGYITTMKEAFSKYIGKDGPAYVEREKITPARAVELVTRASGLPVLAHPFTIPEPEATITELEKVGLAGIEAYYNNYTDAQVSELLSAAEKHGLVATGGSDFHGNDEVFESTIGGAEVPMEAADQLFALAKRKKLRLSGLPYQEKR